MVDDSVRKLPNYDSPDAKQKSASLINFPNTIHKFVEFSLGISSGNRCGAQSITEGSSLDRVFPILIRVRS